MDKERFYTITEVANILNIGEEPTRRLIRSGKLRAFISSRRKGYRVTSSQLDEFLEKHVDYAETSRKKRGPKPKPKAQETDREFSYEKAIYNAKNKPLLTGFASKARNNGYYTILIADFVNESFVYDRRWDLSKHREDNIQVFVGYSLESLTDMADSFESAGFKEFGRGFFDQN